MAAGAQSEGGHVPNKHTPINPKDQKAIQAKARKAAQAQRGSKKFGGKSTHNGASISQSGQPKR
jgi:hypothetical protein